MTFFCNDFQIAILSRGALEQAAKEPFPDGAFVVSIVDSDAEPVRMEHRPTGMLRLAFDDVGNNEFPISCHQLGDADEEDKAIIASMFSPMSRTQAQRVARFVLENQDALRLLICSCEMGQSRSAAVAAAVLEYFIEDASAIDEDARFDSNKLVRHLVLSALHAEQKGLIARQNATSPKRRSTDDIEIGIKKNNE